MTFARRPPCPGGRRASSLVRCWTASIVMLPSACCSTSTLSPATTRSPVRCSSFSRPRSTASTTSPPSSSTLYTPPAARRTMPGRRVMGSSGEALQRGAELALAQPPQRAVAELTDALARHAEHVADLFERVLAAAFEADVQPQHAGVARRQRVQRALDLLREQPLLDVRLRLRGLLHDEPLDELAVVRVADRRVQPDLRRVQRLERLDHLGRQLGRL